MSNQLQITGAAKIRTIQGPVVANSGVITALDGDASEYVRGDGTLADFPTSTGGGSSVSYYLNTSVSQGTIGGVAYKQLSKTPIAGAGTDVTISANGYIASYITDANDPALLEVPAGNFNCEFYFSVNSNAHNPYVYAEVYKYDGTTFTLLGSNVSIPQYLSNGTTLSPYYFAIAVSTAVLTVTDRIAIRIYVNVDGRTVTLHTENNHLCQVVTTFSKGIISLNNLTRQNQFFGTGTSGTDFAISSSVATHTFNLPVASASNTGKLSSTDWSTFNNKQNLLTNPVTGTGSDGRVAFWTGATSISSDANLYYDYSTDRLGIGTNTPNASLGILNSSSTGIQVRTSDSANQYQANIFYDASYGMVYGYNRLGTGTASNLTFFNNIGGFISIPESATNNIGFNTLNPQGLASASVYDFTSLNTNVELRLHNSSTGYTSTDGSFIRVTSTALVIANAETSKSILINNGGNGVVTIDGTNKVAIGDIGVIPMTQQLTVVGSIEAYGGSIYQTVTSSMLKANASGQIIAAIAGTDYLAVGSAVTSVSATSPVLSSGGTTPNISIPAATTSVSGYLTSTDWTTFNNKFTLPSLTQGSILFSDGSTIAQNNNRLYWNNSTMRLGVGSQPVAQYVMYVKANVGENANAWLGIDNDNATGSTAVRLILNGSTTSGFQYVQSTNMTQVYANAGDIQLINGSSLGLTIANTTGNATFSASATATSFVKSGGTSSQFLKADGSVDSTAYGTGSVTSVATSAPLTGGTITTSGTIGITQATTSTNGYLSSTDWNTFNNKTTLPSLTSGSVLFSNGSTIAQDNANFFWDDVNNRLGIGTSAPSSILHILGATATLIIDGNSSGTQTNAFLRLRTGGFNVGNFAYNLATDNIQISNVSGGSGGGVQIYGTGGSTTGLTIAAAGESTFSQKIQISTGGLRIGASATENDRLIVVNGTNLTSGSTQYLEVIAPTYTGNITNLYGRLQYATCDSGTISNAYMLYLGSWSGTSTYSNKWSIYQESTTEKNYFGSAVLIGTNTNSGYKLDVSGTGRFTTTLNVGTTAYVNTDIFIGDTTSGSGRFFITDSSNQGITLRRTGATGDRFKMFVGNGTTYTQDNAIILGTNTDIDFYTGSSPIKRLTIQNGGGLMIPSDVSGTSGYKINYTSADAGSRSWKIANDSAAYGDFVIQQSTTQSGSSYATKFCISPGNDVGIGTGSPTERLDINHSSSTACFIRLRNTAGSGVYVGNRDNNLELWSGGTKNMTITSGGQVQIGTTSGTIMSTIGLVVEENIVSKGSLAGLFTANRASSNFFGFYGSTNFIVYNSNVGTIGSFNATSGAYAGVSDINKKKDFEDSTIGLDAVLGLKPTLYRMKSEDKTLDKHLGFIAQEVKEFIPHAYSETKEGDELFIGLTEMPIIAALVKAIQEQQAIITSLQEQINELKNK
jgi:hypothetical protein